MKQVKAFQTSDGLLFSDQIAADKHELFLEKKDEVSEYIKSELNPYKGRAQLSIVNVTIVNWEMWKAKNASK